MWNEFFPILIPTTAIALSAAVADIACSLSGRPWQLIAGGAGARPDHSISGLGPPRASLDSSTELDNHEW